MKMNPVAGVVVGCAAILAISISTLAQSGDGKGKVTHHWYCKAGDVLFDSDWATGASDAKIGLEQHVKVCDKGKVAGLEHGVVTDAVWQTKYRGMKRGQK
jgi:hypothetical protein